MAREIAKAYEPQQIEPRWAEYWVKEELFKADPSAPGPVFSIVIPPPNVTGSLHIGHMLEHTEIDILTRWRRMRGYNTLYLPGTDHAGISTQRVVVKQLMDQGIDYHKLGREEFEKRVWAWKAEAGGQITEQMKGIGESCDWSRERFTLSPEMSRVVRKVFVQLYKEGFIYRETRLVNWCPVCLTVLSDLEVNHEERAGHLVAYPLSGGRDKNSWWWPPRGRKRCWETRRWRCIPTMNDTSISWERKCCCRLMNREIPIIADEMVEREFGTGAVKITPAHDPNDFEVGKRHGLAEIDVMTDDGKMGKAAGTYAGLDRFEARKKIVEDLKAQGLLEKVTDHVSRDWDLRTQQDDRRTTDIDTVVLQDEGAGGAGVGSSAGIQAGKRKYDSDCAGQPAAGIFELAGQYTGLDDFEAVVVGAPDSGVVLRGLRAHCGGGRGSREMHEVRIGEIDAGSGRAGYLVQLGALAVFDTGLARENGGF